MPSNDSVANGSHNNTDLVVRTIKCLVADLVQQFKGGHPGTAMGASHTGIAVWRDFLRYNPKNGEWFGRDRYVLSVGHACLHQYIMLHLCGYDHWTLDMLKRYHSPRFMGSSATGHPEIEQECGIELTTGLLGQGIANAVGMAVAQKNVQATYSRKGYEDLFDNRVVCMVGDGCLQEGLGQESISISGHLGLDNLILIYDQNKITVDGHIDTVFTEDIPKRFEAANWNVSTVERGQGMESEAYVQAIASALQKARNHKGQPTIIIIPTVIGEGSQNESKCATHGAALGPEDVVQVKKRYGFKENEMFHVSQEVYDHFAHLPAKGAALEKEYNNLFNKYKSEHKEAAAELERRLSGKLPQGWKDLIPAKDKLPSAPQATRKSSGIAVQALCPQIPDFFVGSADLMTSTFVDFKGQVEFQKPESGFGDYTGRQIRYGIREHLMAAMGNGERAYFPQHPDSDGGGMIPVMSSYYIFISYGLPALRMGAMQKLKSITIATHDCIGVGEDGPTHQAVSLSNFFRGEPNMYLYRPADAEETVGCWIDAVATKNGPSIICCSRQNLDLLPGSKRDGVAKGGYIIQDSTSDGQTPDIILVATGSEVGLALETAKLLQGPGADLKVRVVSMPSMSNFDKQPVEYRESILPGTKIPIVAIEAWSCQPWPRYAHAACSMSTFGLSGPYALLFKEFGFDPEFMTEKITAWLERHRTADGQVKLPGCGQFEELLYEHQHGLAQVVY